MPILEAVRALVFGLFLFGSLVAVGSWAIRTRRVNPFSSMGQFIRRTTDPVLRPVEQWLHGRGSNPQNAGWWLLGISVVGGIVLVSLSEWVVVQVMRLNAAGASGPRSILRLFVYYAGQLVIIALIVRVIGSWFHVNRFNRWMRPAYLLTDWIINPLRRIIPPIGMIDITPLVAWLLLQMLVIPMLLRLL